MPILTLRDFSFRYPGRERKALSGISLDIESGDFTLVCGKSGSGKTTLLRCIKPELAPAGESGGLLEVFGSAQLPAGTSAEKIGFVMQDPDNQIVMDSVWLELAFGLENIAVPTEEIGRRIGEIASFFGITSWFGKSVFSLSGGQKQILNLASVIAMQADLIVLDEPTSQLDPIAAKEFMQMLKRVNSELGKTVIMSEHRFEESLALAGKVVYLDNGELKYYGESRDFARMLDKEDHDGFAKALPGPTRLALRLGNKRIGNGGQVDDNAGDAGIIPLDVREGRNWLIFGMKTREFYALPDVGYSAGRAADSFPEQGAQNPAAAVPVSEADHPASLRHEAAAIRVRDLWFRYEKEESFVIKGLEAEILAGTIHAYVGGNGSGKSTLLKLLAGVYQPLKGKVILGSAGGSGGPGASGRPGGLKVRLLPQDTKSVFVCDTVREDLTEHLPGLPEAKSAAMIERLDIGHLLDYHPYDLSGGEMQKVALAKVLLTEPDILLLDEPCKGLDIPARDILAGILHDLKRAGKTVAMATHDIEFAAENADRCSMLFGSAIIAEDSGREFFGRNMFYTTSINRMTRGLISGCILESDIAVRDI